MKNPEHKSVKAEGLPETAITKEGVRFYPREFKWKLSSMTRSRALDFSEFHCIASTSFIDAFKQAMIWSLENHGVNTTYTRFDDLASFIKYKKTYTIGLINSLSSTDFLNYKASLPEKKQFVLSSLASNIRQWHRLGFPGLENDLMALLGEIKLKGTLSQVRSAMRRS